MLVSVSGAFTSLSVMLRSGAWLPVRVAGPFLALLLFSLSFPAGIGLMLGSLYRTGLVSADEDHIVVRPFGREEDCVRISYSRLSHFIVTKTDRVLGPASRGIFSLSFRKAEQRRVVSPYLYVVRGERSAILLNRMFVRPTLCLVVTGGDLRKGGRSADAIFAASPAPAQAAEYLERLGSAELQQHQYDTLVRSLTKSSVVLWLRSTIHLGLAAAGISMMLYSIANPG